MQRVYRLASGLDTAALLAALRFVVDCHPALRVQLVRTADGWAQRFPARSADIAGLKVQGRTAEVRAAYARHVLAQDAQRRIDVQSEPPVFARLIEVDGDHYLGLCVDHVAADELASDLLEAELAAAYQRARRDDPHPAPSPQAYFDYLAAEPARRAREPVALDYWKRTLAGAPLAATPDRDHTWSAGCHAQWELGPAEVQQLARACRSHGCSMFAAVLAAQLDLLRAIGPLEDLVINVPVSNRVLPVEHTWIANLSMLLHLRFAAPAPASPAARLADVRDRLLEAMMHRQYDYPSLSEEVARDAAARGGHVSWLLGCSYLVERPSPQASPPPPGDAALFAERLDDQRDQAVSVPTGSCTFTIRQRATGLRFVADWDPARWPRDASALRDQYLAGLSALTGVPPTSRVPSP